MGRVFICEPLNSKIDLQDAHRFGKLVTLFPLNQKRASVWSPNFREHDIPRVLDEHGFDPEHDHYLVAGHFSTQSIVIAAIALRYGAINLLVFDTKDREYRSIHMGDCKNAA